MQRFSNVVLTTLKRESCRTEIDIRGINYLINFEIYYIIFAIYTFRNNVISVFSVIWLVTL